MVPPVCAPEVQFSALTPPMMGAVSGPEEVGYGEEVAFEAFGVRAAVRSNLPQLLELVPPMLPPGWRPCASSAVECRFAILTESGGTYGLAKDGKGIARGVDLDLALELLDSQIRMHIGETAPDWIFVHAGVVAHRDRAIVMPGRSFSGKTELVAALVRAGCAYYSDEFAVLDERGLVHPYPKPLSLRGEDLWQRDHDVEAIGGVAGTDPLRLGLIAVTTYRADAEWRPRRLSAGEGAMALLANTVPARERPAETMRAISRAADGAIALESDRGEADAVAPRLLAELDPLTV
jgi:hypothetical protein